MLTAVVIGFNTSLETVMEGEMKNVCVVVKPDRLLLDPFDRVPLTIRGIDAYCCCVTIAV